MSNDIEAERKLFEDEVMRIFSDGTDLMPWSAFDGWMLAKRAALAALQQKSVETRPIPLHEIGELLGLAMAEACANGANSISMPDEYVAIAHFLAYPEKYRLHVSPPATPVRSDEDRSDALQDLQFVAGFESGWNAGVDGNEALLRKVRERSSPARALLAKVTP